MVRWYCVYTQPRLELWARTNLWERGFEVYLPQVLKRRRHARRTDIVPRPLFPRYLFVQADIESEGRRAITSAKGVVEVLRCGSGAALTPIDDRIIEEVRNRESEAGFVELSEVDHLRKGDRVRVVEGAFCDQVGLFDHVSDEQRIIILLDLMGRSVRTRVAATNIERER